MKIQLETYCRCRKCIEQEKETTPAKSENYWREQYLFIYERYHKQIRENSQQAERIRELEEHSTKQDFLIDELADSLRAMVAHCEGFISNLKEGK